MKQVGYYNGEIGELSQIKCPILDRSVYFGDGCYDACMVKNGKIFTANMHIDRFFNSARLLKIELGYSKEHLLEEMNKVVSAFSGTQGMLYWQASRGTALRTHAFPGNNIPSNLMMFLIEKDIAPQLKNHRVITREDKRFLYCNIKTLNLLPNVLVTQDAILAGCDEVMLVRDGYVTEMAHSNVSFLINGTFVHHPFDDKILPGISLKNMIEACKQLNIPAEARAITLVEAMNADELISSSSSAFCNRIVEVDGIPVGCKDEANFKKIQSFVYAKYQDETK